MGVGNEMKQRMPHGLECDENQKLPHNVYFTALIPYSPKNDSASNVLEGKAVVTLHKFTSYQLIRLRDRRL